MGKRYYCDFCDRAFADRGVNRKNHFKGVQHKRLRDEHYKAFRGNTSGCWAVVEMGRINSEFYNI